MDKVVSDGFMPKIAYISDLHSFDLIDNIVKKIKEQKDLSLIILGGDFTDHTIPGTIKIVRRFEKIGKPLLLIPGSHENYEIYEKIFEKIKSKNLINGYEQNILKLGSYELIVVGGSSTVTAAPIKMRGGSYWLMGREKDKIKAQEQSDAKLKELKISKKATLVFIEDICSMIHKREHIPNTKKIIISHEPPKCSTKRGIDLAIFGTVTKEFKIKKEDIKRKEFKEIIGNEIFEKGNVLMIEEYKILKKFGYPVKKNIKNVGSKDIRKMMNKNKITKIICGHIHEAGPRAINKREKEVKENTWTKDLRINNGEGSQGHITILELGPEGKIRHEFLKIS